MKRSLVACGFIDPTTNEEFKDKSQCVENKALKKYIEYYIKKNPDLFENDVDFPNLAELKFYEDPITK